MEGVVVGMGEEIDRKRRPQELDRRKVDAAAVRVLGEALARQPRSPIRSMTRMRITKKMLKKLRRKRKMRMRTKKRKKKGARRKHLWLNVDE